MNIKILPVIVIALCTVITGCVGNTARIIAQAGDGDQVTLKAIRDNWDDYYIFYGRRTASYADAIMFDPKNSNTKITGESWIKIEDQEVLDKKIEDIQRKYNNTRVHLIEGPDNQFFGYLFYSSYFHVPIKIVDEQTLYLMPLPPPRSAP